MRVASFLFWLAALWLQATHGLDSLRDGHNGWAVVWFIGAWMAFENMRENREKR